MKVCPHCGAKPTARERIDFLVCSGCCELLYVNELVAARELFVIVQSGSSEPVWAAVTTAKEAEAKAITIAVNSGRSVQLLSGAHVQLGAPA